LWTTPTDLAKFAIAIQNGKAGKSKTVLSQAMTSQILTRQIDDWGLGLNLQGAGREARFGHGGANEGFRCSFIAYDDTGQGAAVMTNSDNGGSLAQEILFAIAHEYGWSGYQPKAITTIQVDPRLLADYAGTYKVPPDQTLTVVQQGDKLVLEADGQKFDMAPESETKFFVLGPDLEVQFAKDDKAKVSSMELEGGTKATKVK
jgi:CubicO group peptidase (beta-lactamase class C family)